MRNDGSKSFLKNLCLNRPPGGRAPLSCEEAAGAQYTRTPSSWTLQKVSASLGFVNMEIHEPWKVEFIIYFKIEAFSELQIQAEDPYNKTKGFLHIYKLIFVFFTCPKKKNATKLVF